MYSQEEREGFGFSWDDNDFSKVFTFRHMAEAYQFALDKCKEFNVHEIHFLAVLTDPEYGNIRLRIICIQEICDWFEE